MSIDLQYLLFLQKLREMTGGAFDEIFNALSKFSVEYLPFLPFVIYWAVHKKWGYRFLVIFNVSYVLSQIAKLAVCAYRPWIRSKEIIPAGDSITAASGYSFPSGHTNQAANVLGTTAVWQKDSHRRISIACVVLALLIGFSRNYLGVHTPQDVIVAMGISVITIAVYMAADKKFGANEKVIDGLTIAGAVFVILSLIYIKVKPYPMDYVDGKLLVDPIVMMNDGFKACGGFAGLLAASWLERHKFHYEIPEGSKLLPLLTGIGLILVISWKNLLGPATVVLWFGRHWGNFIARFILFLFGVLIWPMIITRTCRKEND